MLAGVGGFGGIGEVQHEADFQVILGLGRVGVIGAPRDEAKGGEKGEKQGGDDFCEGRKHLFHQRGNWG